MWFNVLAAAEVGCVLHPLHGLFVAVFVLAGGINSIRIVIILLLLLLLFDSMSIQLHFTRVTHLLFVDVVAFVYFEVGHGGALAEQAEAQVSVGELLPGGLPTISRLHLLFASFITLQL